MEEAIRNQDAKTLVQLMKDCVPSVDTKDLDNPDIQKLQDLKVLLNLSITEIGRLSALSAKNEALKVGSSGEAYIVIPDAQMVEPRGRFTVSLSSQGMLLEGKAMNVFVPWSKVSHIACLPSNVSVKKEGEELIAFLLSEPVTCNNKDTKTFLWNLSKSVQKELSAITPQSEEPIRGTEHSVVSAIVAMSCKKTIGIPNKELFQSVTQQRPYIKCYRGIQEGALYPLKNGLVFLKPLLFIPTEAIASINADRGGGSGSTRYVDLKIETIDGKVHEFTNIEREELLAIQIFVNAYLEARKRAEIKAEKKAAIKKEYVKLEPGLGGGVEGAEGVDGGEGGEGEAGEGEAGDNEDDDDDDDESDEDFDPDADSDASGRDSDDSRASDSEGEDDKPDRDDNDMEDNNEIEVNNEDDEENDEENEEKENTLQYNKKSNKKSNEESRNKSSKKSPKSTPKKRSPNGKRSRLIDSTEEEGEEYCVTDSAAKKIKMDHL